MPQLIELGCFAFAPLLRLGCESLRARLAKGEPAPALDEDVDVARKTSDLNHFQQAWRANHPTSNERGPCSNVFGIGALRLQAEPAMDRLCAIKDFRAGDPWIPGRKPWKHVAEDHDRQLTFVDWDDTILPTTALRSGKMDFEDLDTTATALLETMLKASRVVIVTNARRGWVEASAEYFLPGLFERVLWRVEIISARDEHSYAYPGNTVAWKAHTFRDVLAQSPQVQHVLSVGDSLDEMLAMDTLVNHRWSTSRVKMMAAPTPRQLAEQQQVLAERFPALAAGRGEEVTLDCASSA